MDNTAKRINEVEGALNLFREGLKSTEEVFKFREGGIFGELNRFFKTNFDKGFGDIKALRKNLEAEGKVVKAAVRALNEFNEKEREKRKRKGEEEQSLKKEAERNRIEERLELLRAEKKSEADVFERAFLDRAILDEEEALRKVELEDEKVLAEEAIAARRQKREDDVEKAKIARGETQKKLEKAENRRARDGFFFNQNLSVGLAIINAALAATKALVTSIFPLNLINAATVLATGAAQTSAILGQKAPSLFSGGLIAAGKSAIVGDIPGDFSRAELVTPASPSAVIPTSILEKLALGFSPSSSRHQTENQQTQHYQTENHFYFDTVDLIETQNEIQRLSGQTV